MTACRRAVWAGVATSQPDVELLAVVLLPGDFSFSLGSVVALSSMLALGVSATTARMMMYGFVT